VKQICSDCPMKGKRAAEMATGHLLEVFDDLAKLTFNAFSTQLHSDLAPRDRVKLEQDFEQAKAYMQFGLSAKFSFWEKLPWKMWAGTLRIFHVTAGGA